MNGELGGVGFLVEVRSTTNGLSKSFSRRGHKGSVGNFQQHFIKMIQTIVHLAYTSIYGRRVKQKLVGEAWQTLAFSTSFTNLGLLHMSQTLTLACGARFLILTCFSSLLCHVDKCHASRRRHYSRGNANPNPRHHYNPNVPRVFIYNTDNYYIFTNLQFFHNESNFSAF